MKKYFVVLVLWAVLGCHSGQSEKEIQNKEDAAIILPDTTQIPNDEFGQAVAYGRSLMLNTAYYIGPDGINGQYLGNKMNCTNCHQHAGTKPFSLNLMQSHERYPQYRARENAVITLAQRVNNCVERPHNGKPLPLDSKEMIAILSYLKWINSFVVKTDTFVGSKNLSITFPAAAASPERGAQLYTTHCQRCHGADGEGIYTADSSGYTYPPLWGKFAYQPGSSMHRVIMQAKWLKANMPNDLATWQKPILTDAEALDIAAFVNNDAIHYRNQPKTFDFPNPKNKALDYGKGPYADTFPELQHKYGPYQPIIDYWRSNGLKPNY
jgi:thiosulfate dehydrogenase